MFVGTERTRQREAAYVLYVQRIGVSWYFKMCLLKYIEIALLANATEGARAKKGEKFGCARGICDKKAVCGVNGREQQKKTKNKKKPRSLAGSLHYTSRPERRDKSKICVYRIRMSVLCHRSNYHDVEYILNFSWICG